MVNRRKKINKDKRINQLSGKNILKINETKA